MIGLLAQTAQHATGMESSVSGTVIVGIIGALGTFAGIIGGIIGGIKKGEAKVAKQRVHLEPNPVPVRVEELPVSRGEFREFRDSISNRVIALETAQIRATDNVEKKHLELLATIERAAKTGVDGRVALWNALKPVEREVAQLVATSNVAEQLSNLADILKPRTPEPHVR